MTIPVQAVVLAAGKGTRMKSNRAKVLHEIFFAPMLHHVLTALSDLPLSRTVVVTGHQAAAVEAATARYPVRFARQKEQLGTGHAVLAAAPALDQTPSTIVVLCGDTPLIRTTTLAAMLAFHREKNARLTVMTTELSDPSNYGRVVTEAGGAIARIVEEKDASPAERSIMEINAGIYCADRDFLFNALQQVGTSNSQGEVYLTDVVAVARAAGHPVYRFSCPDPAEVLGVNSRIELAQAHAGLQQRRNRELMADGVTMIHPETITVDRLAEINRDTVLHPDVSIEGRTVIAEGCTIGRACMIRNCRIGAGAMVGPFSLLTDCTIGNGDQVPPYTHGAGSPGGPLFRA